MNCITRSLLIVLTGLLISSLVKADQIVLTEIMYNPPGAKPEYVEVKNISWTPRDIAKWKLSEGVTYEFPDFNLGSPSAHLLGALEKIIISSADPATTRTAYPWIPAQQRVFGPWTGILSNSGETITLEDKNAVDQATVKYGSNGRWPKAADGTGHSLMIINENCSIDDFLNWKVSSGRRDVLAGTPVTVITLGDQWRYLTPVGNIAPGGWNTYGFNDSSWGLGSGLLGRESGNSNLPAPGMQTNTLPAPTVNNSVYFFRKTFTYSGGNAAAATVAIDHAADDGVTYYLNGQLLGSVRHTPPNITSDTAGWPGDVNGVELNVLVKAGSTGLQDGNNVLCAELHQSTETSSDAVFGAQLTVTPGAGNSMPLRLSEVHFATDGNVDWVELQNSGGIPQSVAGLFLSSKNDFTDKVALTGSVGANGFLSFSIPNGGFDAEGNGNIAIFLIDSGNNVIGAADLTHVAGRDSIQAVWPVIPASKPAWDLVKTREEWYSSATATQNTSNSALLATTSIVINEIMSDPMSEQDQAEYIELYNKSGSPMSLTGWKLRGGVDFDFPSGTSIPASGYLVIGGNKVFLQSVYPSATIVGNWSGKLGNKNDYLRLEDQHGNLADEVKYKSGGDWPDFGTYRGSSMELINPDMDNSRASAWKASDESNKTTFGTYSYTGTYLKLFHEPHWVSNPRTVEEWSGNEPRHYKEFFFHCPKDAHIILKNIRLTTATDGSGPNLLENATQKSSNGSSASGWLCQGTHAESYFSGADFHLTADGHGDQRPNHAEIDCTGIQPNTSYTITFEARWVAGSHRLYGTTWDHSLGKNFLLDVPNNLGTAGAVNSRFNGTISPQVDSVIHSPAVPKSTDTVKITARVHSVAPLSAVEALVRQDSINNGNSYSAVAMSDNGSNGDSVAGDGVYTAMINNHQENNRKVQFYVRATANNGAKGYSPPNPYGGGEVNRPAMWMVDNRIVSTNLLRSQRFIMSEYDLDSMKTGSAGQPGTGRSDYGYKYTQYSSHYFPMTFIHNEMDVYYLCELHEGGSIWSRSTRITENADNELYRGKWKIPSDRVFRNREKTMFDKDLDFGIREGAEYTSVSYVGFPTRATTYLLYLLGYPAINEEEYCFTLFNDLPIKVKNDNELTDNEMMKRSFKNGDQGELYEATEEFQFRDDLQGTVFRQGNWYYKGTDDPVRYITDFPMRMREIFADYSPLTDMLKVVSNSSNPRELVERVLDVDMIMLTQAVRGSVCDWDSYFNGGKNGYLYRRPDNGKIIHANYDNDSAFASFTQAEYDNPNFPWINSSVTGGMLGYGQNDPSKPDFNTVFLNRPYVRKRLNYYLTELYTKYLTTNFSSTNRFMAYVDAQIAANSAWPVNRVPNRQKYINTINGNRQHILNAINQRIVSAGGTELQTSKNYFGKTFAVTSPSSGGSTSSSTVNLTGDAPSGAFSVAVDNHPEAMLNWASEAVWNLNGIILKAGSNNLVLRMLDKWGAQVGDTINWNITKTGNALPAVKMMAEPDNVKLGEALMLDASGSYDPDNNVLTFSWNHTPASGLTLTTPAANPANSKRQAVFSMPGIYSFTVQSNDGSGSSSVTREVAVANTEDFEPFTVPTIDTTKWTIGGMENRDSASGSRWYSLYDLPGKLVVQILENSAKPLTYGNNQPTLLRNLAPGTDSTLLTEVTLEGRKTGTFFAGLYLETSEGKYAFGLDNGIQISAKRSTGGGFSDLSAPVTTLVGNEAKLRIRRIGNMLNFERKVDGVWNLLFTHTMADGSTLSKGGVFHSTASAENARVSFDYIMVADPGNAGNSVFNNLRITELMYNPRGANDAEYIEVKNTGAGAIDLNGVNITNGVTLNIAGTLSLAPGQIAIFTDNAAAFNAQYAGFLPAYVVQWNAGNLSNGGERIVLRDGDGNAIHDFTYSDASPWPTAADGNGMAIEVVNTNSNYSDPANWRATGAMPGGGTDTDGDGTPDAWEAKFGTNSTDPLSKPRTTTSVNGSNQTQISWGGVNGQNYRVEYCDNLGDYWQTVTGAVSVAGVNGTVSFTDPQLPRPVKRFYRIVAL